jgi:hypothetical protein
VAALRTGDGIDRGPPAIHQGRSHPSSTSAACRGVHASQGRTGAGTRPLRVLHVGQPRARVASCG